MLKINVTARVMEELLATSSADPELHSRFVASKSADAEKQKEELAALSAVELEERGMTVFPRDNGQPFIWDYQIKGFLKAAVMALLDIDNSTISTKEYAKKLGLTRYMYKRTIDTTVFVFPRKIPLVLPEETEIGRCQRPLRVETMRGERVALANSETVPEGTELEFSIHLLKAALEPTILEALAYGKFKGLGQWSNSGKGRFDFTHTVT